MARIPADSVTGMLRQDLLSFITKAEITLGYILKMKFENGLKDIRRLFVENWDMIENSAEFSGDTND